MTPRQFEPGFSTEFTAIQLFLERHGYGLKVASNRWQVKHPGSARWKASTWNGVIKIVDDIRASQGLETIRVRKAA